MAKDLYAVLGVAKTADADEIKKVYRKLAAKLHPDKNPGDKAAESRFKEINHANDVLSNPQKRTLYDEFGEEGLRDGFDAEQARAYAAYGKGRGRGAGGQGDFMGGIRMEDIFGGDMIDDLFGRATRGGRGAPAGARGGRKRGRGADMEGEVTIDFATAVRGGTIQLTLEGGKKEPLTIRVGAGAEEGTHLRIPGQGGPATSAAGEPGDLTLKVHVAPHKHFRREGDDLHLELPITLTEAYFGGKIRVPTFEGPVTMKVPAKAQSGQVMRLKGKGVARKGHDPGDLYVHFQVTVPTSDDPAIVKALEAVAKLTTEDPRAGIET